LVDATQTSPGVHRRLSYSLRGVTEKSNESCRKKSEATKLIEFLLQHYNLLVPSLEFTTQSIHQCARHLDNILFLLQIYFDRRCFLHEHFEV
ncbi:hypothetical protein PENTCL1PPCAC_23379, partial [Pristionchus entomophagus]